MDIKIYNTGDAASTAVSESKPRLSVRAIDSNAMDDFSKAKSKKSASTKQSLEVSQVQQMRAQITRLQEEKRVEAARVTELRQQNSKLADDGKKMYNLYQKQSNKMEKLGAQYDKLKEYTLQFEEEGLRSWNPPLHHY